MTTFIGKVLILLSALTLIVACGGGGGDNGAKPVAVPNVVGQTESAATAAIVAVGLRVGGSTSASSSTVPAGSVVAQNPTAGTMMSRGSPVGLVVSSGTPAQTVQSVVVMPAIASISQGATLQFSAMATYEDGHSDDVTINAAWSSGAPSIATVSGSGLVTALDIGAAAISARFGTVSGASALTVTANLAPVANAGPSQNVVPGTVVTLDGSSSSDANSDPLSFAWNLEKRPRLSAAALKSADTPMPTFKADAAGTYIATLIVNDGRVESAPAHTIVSAGTEGIPGQGTWETTLQPRDLDGDGVVDAYYDTAQNITWLADRELPLLTLSEAKSWVASLNVHGVTGWRLFEVQASPNPPYSPTSELSKLYFDTLGNVVMNWSNVGPFWFITPLEAQMPPPPGWYWSGTPAPEPSGSNWGFSLGILDYVYFDANYRLWVWPVRTGDVAAASTTAASD